MKPNPTAHPSKKIRQLEKRLETCDAEIKRYLEVEPSLPRAWQPEPTDPLRRAYQETVQKRKLVAAELLKRAVSVPPAPRPSQTHGPRSTAIDEPPPGRRMDPDVAKRRAIVQGNPELPAQGICELFDQHAVPLPKTMCEAGTWVKAYKAPIYNPKIRTIISKDRKEHA